MTHPTTPALPLPALYARIRALAQRPARTAQNAFFIEGLRSFIQAHDAGFRFQSIIYSPILLKGDLADMLARRLHASGTPRIKLSPEQFRGVSLAARASGIGAIVRQRWSPLTTPRQGLCHLVVEQIRSPGNLGTLMRTAEATGVASVIFVGNLSDPYHPAAVRASMGGLFHLPLIRTTHDQLAAWSRTHHVQLVGLSPDAPRLWTQLPQATPHAPLALVLGEERNGISPRLQSLCGAGVKLPMTGRANSLNVSTAAAVMLYELVRALQDGMICKPNNEVSFHMKATKKYIGKRLLVGLTYVDADDEVTKQVQIHGTISRVTDEGIFFDQADGSGELSLPPDVSSLQAAKPGIYRLRSTGEEIENPDFVTVWTIKAPPTKGN